MKIPDNVLTASTQLHDFLKLVSESNINTYVNLPVFLKQIKDVVENSKPIIEFYRGLSLKGELSDFYKSTFGESKKPELMALMLSGVQIYRLHLLLWNLSVNFDKREIAEIAEYLNPRFLNDQKKICDLPFDFHEVVSSAMFGRIDDDCDLNDDSLRKCLENAANDSIFVLLDQKSLGYLEFANDFNRQNYGLIHFENHAIHESICVYFKQVKDNEFDVCLSFLNTDYKSLVQLQMIGQGMFFDPDNACFIAGRLINTPEMQEHNTRIVSGLFQLLTEFKKVYNVQTQYLYKNHFLEVSSIFHKAEIFDASNKSYS